MLLNYLKIIFEEFVIKALIIVCIGGFITTFITENLTTLRTSIIIKNAKKRIALVSNSKKLQKNQKKIKRAVSALLEIANSKQYLKQEMIDIFVKDFFRKHFDCANTKNIEKLYTEDELKIKLFFYTLKGILSLKRTDENDYPLNIDLHQISIISNKNVYCENVNFKGVTLWGCIFKNVNFSRSNFEDTNIGGCLFSNCGFEMVNLTNAKISYSPIDERPTYFDNCKFYKTLIGKADIYDDENQLKIVRPVDLEHDEYLTNHKGVEFVDFKTNFKELLNV